MTRQTQKLSLKETLPPREYELLEMLTYRRPAWSSTELDFIDKYIKSLGVEEDGATEGQGNLWKTVGTDSPILWSCHTDTVHRTAGKQHLAYTEYGEVYADKTTDCLGADDAAGVWIMRQMILANIPGTYVFHVGEEISGVGSRWAAKNLKDKIQLHSAAIAFDRKGDSDIITHQSCGRTASDAFAVSLAECLKPLNYEPSDGGTFTDTASYSELVAECSNLAVGYDRQHTPKEYLDTRHTVALLDALLAADFSGLVFARDPAVREYKTYSYGGYKGNSGINKYGGILSDEEYADWWENQREDKTNDAKVIDIKGEPIGDDEGLKRLLGGGVKQITHQVQSQSEDYEMEELVRTYPEDIALFLSCQGFTVSDIEDWVLSIYGPDNH